MNKVFYPKTMDDIEKLIDFNKKIYKDDKLEEFLKWEKWFDGIKKKIKINLEDNEYINISFKSNNKFSLEVWEKGDNYDSICYNIASNNYNEFNNELTIIEKS